MPAKAIARKASNGKGIGLFALVDHEPGELIFVEDGVSIPMEEGFRPPWPGSQELGPSKFEQTCWDVLNNMSQAFRILRDKATSQEGAQYGPHSPEDFDTLFYRPDKHTRPDPDEVFEAIQKMRDDITVQHKQRAQKFMARFFEDVREYNAGGVSVLGFGLLIGLVNHCCHPNAEIELCLDRPGVPGSRGMVEGMTLHLRAIQDIKAGDEITIEYPIKLGDSRDSHRASIKNTYGFECRCGTCIAEQNSAKLRELKDIALVLIGEMNNTPWLSSPQVFRKAALVLDAFDEIGLKHRPLYEVLQCCVARAVESSDMLRAHFFSKTLLKVQEDAFGKVEKFYEIEQTREWIADAQRKTIPGLQGGSLEGHSVWQPYYMEQNALTDMMFMMNHTGDEYHALRVVGGKVEEIPVEENLKRIDALKRERDQAVTARLCRENMQLDQENRQKMSVDELCESLGLYKDQGEETSKKKSKKKKRVGAHTADDDSQMELPKELSIDGGAAGAPEQSARLAGETEKHDNSKQPENTVPLGNSAFQSRQEQNASQTDQVDAATGKKPSTTAVDGSTAEAHAERSSVTDASRSRSSLSHSADPLRNTLPPGSHRPRGSRFANPLFDQDSYDPIEMVSEEDNWNTATSRRELKKKQRQDATIRDMERRHRPSGFIQRNSHALQPARPAPARRRQQDSDRPTPTLPARSGEKESKRPALIPSPPRFRDASTQTDPVFIMPASEFRSCNEMAQKMGALEAQIADMEGILGLIRLSSREEATAAPKPVTVAAMTTAYQALFLCPFGAPDATSKQAWLANKFSKVALRLEARDIGHLLAAKDGMGVGQEGFVLSARRDSVSGRVEGEKEFVELRGKAARKARTHSFGNDGGKKDLLKEAEIGE